MKHKIPVGNWHIALADAIEVAKDGDEIEVHTQAMKELGENARVRMCPDKKIRFIVVAEANQ